MKKHLKIASIIVYITGSATATAAFAQQHINDFILNVPIKFVGDSTKVKTGVWVNCTVVRQAGGAHRQIHQDYTLAHPGDLIVAPPDGTFNIAFEWTIPPDMKSSETWGDAPYDWACTLYKGGPQQNLSGAISYIENGDPVAPATFGTCDYIKGQLNADFTVSIHGIPYCGDVR